MIEIRLATDDDFRSFFKQEPPKTWTALSGVRDGEVVGIGGIVHNEYGVAVGFLDTRERPGLTLHRAARFFMSVMKRTGEPVIFTACDDTIPRAEEWLMRLGFKLLPDVIDNQRIWRWQC